MVERIEDILVDEFTDKGELIDLFGQGQNIEHMNVLSTNITDETMFLTKPDVKELFTGDVDNPIVQGKFSRNLGFETFLPQLDSSYLSKDEAIDKGYQSLIDSGVDLSKEDYVNQINNFNVTYENIPIQSFGVNEETGRHTRENLNINLKLNNPHDNYIINSYTANRYGSGAPQNTLDLHIAGGDYLAEEMYYVDILTSDMNETNFQIIAETNALPDTEAGTSIKKGGGEASSIFRKNFEIHDIHNMLLESKDMPKWENADVQDHWGEYINRSGDWKNYDKGIKIVTDAYGGDKGNYSKFRQMFPDQDIVRGITIKDKTSGDIYYIQRNDIKDFLIGIGAYSE